MPRPGGESEKFGNRYEAIWTVGVLLEVAAGKAHELTVEPIGVDALGIEFVLRQLGGTRECHSVKRQRSKGEWTLAALTRSDAKTKRSILGDLVGKLLLDNTATCCFVSGTGASEFNELWQRANQRKTFREFETDLRASNTLRDAFDRYVAEAGSDGEAAFRFLQRTRVVLIDEVFLTQQVEQHISYLVYRPHSEEFHQAEVRLLLGDFVLGHLGSTIRRDAIWQFLAGFGYAKRDWANDPTVGDVVRKRNEEYLRAVGADLINGAHVPRTDAVAVVHELTQCDGARTVLLSASAGVGKSCVIAQAVTGLESCDVPVLVVRMDRHGDAHSTQEIGSQMALARSPAIVLAGASNGRDSVLVVDQLDAVSQVSGRYPFLWEVFDSLCHEVEAYPNMRLLIACRDFDLEQDHRLRKLSQRQDVKRVSVQPFSVEDVDAAILKAGYAAPLSAREKEILRTPLHLFLFLEGRGEDSTDISIGNIGDLFRRYWERKQRAVSARCTNESTWPAVIDKLCKAMSDSFTVCAPGVVVDDWSETVKAMLTEHVLVRDGNQIRFFHESFFDYAFARRFCAMNQRILSLMESGEQHLFRRSQVRQILAFMRDSWRSRYLAELREILTDSDVRFHIKRVVIAWLGTVVDPTREEWMIVESLLALPDLQRHALPAVRNSLAWFDLLNDLGVITQWLADDNHEVVNRALWFMLYDQVQKLRSDVVAKLLAPYRGRSPAWDAAFRNFFRLRTAYQGRAIQEFFLQLLDDGVFYDAASGAGGSWWSCLHNAGKEAPLFVIEAIAHWLDRRIAAASQSPGECVLERSQRDQAAEHLIGEVAAQSPKAYIDQIMPRIVSVIGLSERLCGHGLRRDTVWGVWSNFQPTLVPDALLQGLVTSFEQLAVASPDDIGAITGRFLETDSNTITVVLLRAWSANPVRFADECLRFLAADRRRLDIGYVCWSGGGNPSAAISRQAIQTCVPHARDETCKVLERAIIGIAPHGDEGTDEGYTERLLLESFGDDNLSDSGRQRLIALRTKFPHQDTAITSRHSSGMQPVESPITPESAGRFSDDEWLGAMREYDFGWDDHPSRPFRSDGRPQGSAVELSRLLRSQVRLDRPRFARLVNRMDDTYRAEYFAAILGGMCGQENLTKDQRHADEEEFRQLATETVLSVARRLHRLPNRPCGREICDALERLADRPIPDADLQVLAYYALEDPDPKSDSWLEQEIAANRDPAEHAYVVGYNTVRGHAARAIESLLFADYSRSTVLVAFVERMVHDPSMAVRTCIVPSLGAIWNHDRDAAVRFFLQACQGAEVVVGCDTYENFVRYASRTHYASLRDLLLGGLCSNLASAVAASARQICLAAFANDLAEADAARVRMGTETMRRGAAEVYSCNLSNPTIGPCCRGHLPSSFSDESEQVRAAAADCFNHLQDADFTQFVEIIQAYIESPAFPSQYDALLRRLESSTWELPEITLRLAERFVAALGSDAGNISTAASADAPTVSKLVIRLYAQSTDDTVRSKCLDLIDKMERLAFYGIDTQLAELDR